MQQIPLSMVGADVWPAGTVLDFAGSTAPTGWLLCYGQAVSRTTYAALFAAIGVVYGAGDGSTTFALPDLRGRVAAGKDDMGGSAAGRLTSNGLGVGGTGLGNAGGGDTQTLSISHLPAHGHPFQLSVNTASPASSTTTGGFMLNTNTSSSRTAYAGNAGNTAGEQIGGTGGNAAHSITQPTMVLNKIIKT